MRKREEKEKGGRMERRRDVGRTKDGERSLIMCPFPVTDRKDFRPSPPLSVGGCLPHFRELSSSQHNPGATHHFPQAW